METGDAVGPGGEAQTHQGHVELAVVGGALAELDELVDRDTALFGERAEVGLEEFEGELVDAGGHRRVRREDAAGAHRFDRLGERQAEVDPFADAFEPEETGVALVGVEHLRIDAESTKGAHTTDAEDDLLAKPVLLVSSVQPIGHRDRLGRVGRHVGVEQVQRDPPGVDAPHPNRDVDTGEVDVHLDTRRLDAECVGIDALVALALPPVAVELLVEVALGVQQPDADEGHAEIGTRLEVIAREHAESPRVLRERLGDAELGREVGDQVERGLAVGAAPAEPARSAEFVVETLAPAGDLLDVLLVVGERLPARRCRASDEIDGMLPGLAPRGAAR